MNNTMTERVGLRNVVREGHNGANALSDRRLKFTHEWQR